jgi:hypothetical protein
LSIGNQKKGQQMKVIKIINAQREGAKYALCQEDKETISLQRIILSEGTGKDEFQTVKSKNVKNGIITRKQYNPNTGALVGKSVVDPPTKHKSGSMIVNDASIKMEKPYHFFQGKISKGDLVRPKGLQIIATEKLSPMAQRFLRLVQNACGGVLRL